MKEVGVGTRVLDFLVDTIPIFFIALGLFKWWSFHVFHWGYTPIAFYQFFFATLFVYYSLFEIIFARTPGKWLTMTKVVNDKGGRAAWYQILVRSLVRLTIIYPFFIPILKRPLHDALSKTRVVET